MDVSHPASPNYGKHWTSKEVMDMFAPSAETVRDVFEWLEDAGFERERVRYTQSTGASGLALASFYATPADEHINISTRCTIIFDGLLCLDPDFANSPSW